MTTAMLGGREGGGEGGGRSEVNNNDDIIIVLALPVPLKQQSNEDYGTGRARRKRWQ